MVVYSSVDNYSALEGSAGEIAKIPANKTGASGGPICPLPAVRGAWGLRRFADGER